MGDTVKTINPISPNVSAMGPITSAMIPTILRHDVPGTNSSTGGRTGRPLMDSCMTLEGSTTRTPCTVNCTLSLSVIWLATQGANPHIIHMHEGGSSQDACAYINAFRRRSELIVQRVRPGESFQTPTALRDWHIPAATENRTRIRRLASTAALPERTPSPASSCLLRQRTPV